MHFALVTETYPPEINGVALTVQGLEHGLRALGHEVSVARPRQPSGDQATDSTQLLLPGAGLPRYPGLRFGLPAGSRLLSQWRHRRPDAVYVATEGPLGWSAVRSAARLGIPAATGFHTRFDQYAARYGAGFLTPLVFAWLRRFHNAAAATIVPTDELAGFLRQRGFAQVQLLRRAVDTHLFDPARRSQALRDAWGLRDDAPCLIYVGRLAPEKDLQLAVQAFRSIQTQIPEARFVLVGDGPSRAQLQREHPDLIFAGLRRGEELATHFASGDLFLFPSQSETFGNVTLEAMASGVPTIAYYYGAARQHLIDGAHGAAVAMGDSAMFLQRSLELALDKQARSRMGLAARSAVLPLNPAGVAQRFAELLGNLASRSAA